MIYYLQASGANLVISYGFALVYPNMFYAAVRLFVLLKTHK